MGERQPPDAKALGSRPGMASALDVPLMPDALALRVPPSRSDSEVLCALESDRLSLCFLLCWPGEPNLGVLRQRVRVRARLRR